MIEKAKRDRISNLQPSFPSTEFARMIRAEVEESDTLCEFVIRICDQYALNPREHCRA